MIISVRFSRLGALPCRALAIACGQQRARHVQQAHAAIVRTRNQRVVARKGRRLAVRVARIVRVGEREREPRDGRRARGRQSQQNFAAGLFLRAKKSFDLSY